MDLLLFDQCEGLIGDQRWVPLFSSSVLTAASSCVHFHLFSFSLASFSALLFSKHLCALTAISLPRHSWRSDRHGESVGQQPWNKYGWSWVRWARIICFAICLRESVDVMTVVLPSSVSLALLGSLTETHNYYAQRGTHTHKGTQAASLIL